jgi:hypothetical protein
MNLEVHHCFHKNPPLVPILGQNNPTHTTSSCLTKMHLNIISIPGLGLPSDIFPPGLPTNKIYVFFASINATYLIHHILLDFIILVILC